MFVMMLNLNTKFLYGCLLFIIPAYTWSKFFKIWRKLSGLLASQQLFYKRHNCVVMYRSKNGVVGWPSTEVENFLPMEPILYFIKTANKSLDIAMMSINVESIVNELIKAHKRGVRIRVLLDHHYSKNSIAQHLGSSGIHVVYYFYSGEDRSIMHYKYMLKDYSDKNGYVYIGSLNWTCTSFRTNFEDTVFTSNRTVVDAIHENFEFAWTFIKDLNETNPLIKAKLEGIQQ